MNQSVEQTKRLALDENADQNTRRKAIKALGKSQDRSVIPALVKLVEQPQFRHTAFVALFNLGALDLSFPWLHEVKNCSARHIQIQFKHTLLWLSEKPLEKIKKYLSSKTAISPQELGLRIF